MLLNKIKNLITSKFRKKTIFKQELLLRKALKEKGFDLTMLKIESDHDLGLNYINGIELGIKYPDSFFYKAQKLISNKKESAIFFNGFINESGGRKELLEPFNTMTDSIIISSYDGRIQSKKDTFNEDYFFALSNSKFGLCPHQKDWPGSKKHMWTYRFIECCFTGTIPVVFKSTPLGKSFIEGFFYVWDDEFKKNYNAVIDRYSYQIAKENNRLAKNKFCISDEEIKAILSSL